MVEVNYGTFQLTESCDKVNITALTGDDVVFTGIYPGVYKDRDGTQIKADSPKQLDIAFLETFSTFTEVRDMVMHCDDDTMQAYVLLSGGTLLSERGVSIDPNSSGVHANVSKDNDGAVSFYSWARGSYYTNPLLSQAFHTGHRSLKIFKAGDYPYSGELSWSALNDFTRTCGITGDLNELTFEIYGEDTAGDPKFWILTEKNNVTVERTEDLRIRSIRAMVVSETYDNEIGGSERSSGLLALGVASLGNKVKEPVKETEPYGSA